MIFVGRRDAGEEGILGFGGGGGGAGREMEETELEEGEACSYNNNLEAEDHDYGSEMDPDIDLSYLDEKLQNVLGHFQKDFEGGVSAENLGAKFGGYGSFLPTYQRSPLWSHSRTPPKTQFLNAPRSPNHLQLEGGHRSSVSSTNTVQSGRLKTSFSGAASIPESRTPSSLFDSVKPEEGMPSTHFSEEFGSRCDIGNRNSDNSSDQKMLKVRIKMGSDNLLTGKNAAIYSGLGLDVSPSSSLDGSTSDSEGIPNEPHDALESPIHIIQMMTVFPVQGDRLLSPLGNDLNQLTKKDKLLKDRPSLPFSGAGPQVSMSATDAYDFVEDDGKKLGAKKVKSLASNNIPVETMRDSNDFRSAVHGILRKDADVDTLACEELVSNTLKLPLLSSSHTASSGMGKVDQASPLSRESKGAAKDRALSNLNKEDPSVLKITAEDCVIQNPRATAGAKVSEDRKINSLTPVLVNQEEDGHFGKEKAKAGSDVDRGRKALSSKQIVPPKQKADQKSSAYELEVTKIASANEDSERRKKKGSKKHGNLVVDLPKESLGVDSLSERNCENGRYADEIETKGKAKDLKLRRGMSASDNDGTGDHNRGLRKNDGTGDCYKEFFGDLELELDENQMSVSDIGGNGRPGGSEFERKRCGIDDPINERAASKKIDKLSTSETRGQAASRISLHSTDGPVFDATPAASASGVAKDNWVGCDKCQKWRLLPRGKNPNDLPEKWICSMLNWLPGMNDCRFSEEETTNALIPLYQVPAPESQIGVQNYAGAVKSRYSVEDVWQRDHNLQSIGSHGMPIGGKKRGSKEQSSALPKEGSTQLPNPVRKNKHALLASGHSNNVRQSTLTSEPDMRLSNSTDLMVERHRNKRKDKYKDLQSNSDKDNSKISKMKNKVDSDQDFARTSKKVKTDHLAEEWRSNNGGTIVKAGPGSSKSNVHNSGKNMSKRNDQSSFKHSRYKLVDGVQVSYKRPRDGDQNSLDDKSLDKRNLDDRDTMKKRKTKDGSYLVSLPNSGQHLHDNRILGNDLSENEYRKKKKARVSRSEGKETSSGTGNGRAEKNSHKKNQQVKEKLGCIMTQQIVDGVDSFKRDSGPLHPSLAATSSSSKVSGSRKTKTSFQDPKGSPVESVSSSPLRVSKPEKLMSPMPNVTDNVESIGVGFNPPAGLKRCSDGEDDGRGNRFGTARKENRLDVAYHDSFESVITDHQEKTSSHLSGGEAKVDILPSPNATNNRCSNGEHKQHPGESTSLDRCHDDGRQKDNLYQLNRSCQVKLGKGLSLQSKDRKKNSSSEFDIGEDKVPDSVVEQVHSSGLKRMDGQNKVEVRSDVNQDEYVDKKDSAQRLSSESGKRENQLQFEVHNGPNVKVDAIGSHQSTSASKKCLLQDCEAVSGMDDLSQGAQGEKPGRCLEKGPSSQEVDGSDIMADDVPGNENMSRAEKQVGKFSHSNGMQNGSSRNLLSNGHRIKEDAPSSTKRDLSNQAATNAVKEAKNLKHKADRLKNSGMNLESTRLYFEASLKFLHGAALLETFSNDSAKNGEMIQSMQMYSSTAKLCDFCAHEYEKSKDMAAAALAYKCMEVAYTRVVCGSHTIANRDRHELQKALQMIPPGESPSSSASDIDNLNHTMGEKGTLSKGTSSPQVAGSHVIAAGSRPSFVRLLNFAQDVNFAMEASRKSRTAFASAVVNLGEAKPKDGILSVKTALDYNFQDVEGLLRLVRLAFDSISN